MKKVNVSKNVAINVAAEANSAATKTYAAGLTQVDLGRKMGLSIRDHEYTVKSGPDKGRVVRSFTCRTVSQWENGKSYPNRKNLPLLRVIFGDLIRVERDMDCLKVV